MQATVVRPVADRPNHFVMGLTLDGARSRYESDTELARLSPDRGTIGSGLLDAEAAVRLRTRVHHSSVYLADFFTVAPGLTLMGSARYNYSTVRLRDQIGDDLTGDHTFSRVDPGVGATYTFDTPYVVTSPNHPDAAGGEIAIARGASIPSVPRHNLKADLSVTAGRIGLGAGVGRTSSQYLRGDEANRLDPIDGASLVHLSASVALHPRARIVGRVTNLFGREYETFGVLGEADDVLGDEFDDPRFVSPGAPRAAWIGLEVSFR